MKNPEFSGKKVLAIVFNEDVWVFKLNSDDETIRKIEKFLQIERESPCG
jgi:hypothetical protein